ncbi:Cytochrome P450 82A3 [Linum perenne]
MINNTFSNNQSKITKNLSLSLSPLLQMDWLLVQSISTTSLLLVSILIFFSYKYIIKNLSRSESNASTPPEASGAWPVIGHLLVLAGRELPHKSLGALADKHGPIFRLRLGVRQVVVISSWEIAKEIFTTHDMSVSSRPPITASRLLGYNFILFAFSPYGPYWREMRKLSVLELLSNRRLQLLKHVRGFELATSLRELHARVSSSGGPVELKQWVSDLTLNSVLQMVVGKRGCGSTSARRMQKAVRMLFRYLGQFVVRDAFPLLGWADLGGYEKEMKKVAAEMDLILDEWLHEHKRKRDHRGRGRDRDRDRDDGGEAEEEDFMDVLLSLRDEGEDFSGYDSDTVIKSTCLAMIAAGTDTTTVTVTWAISLLLNNRQALNNVQKELNQVVSKERILPNDDELTKLVYLQAVVKETLRLYPAAPLSSPRQFIANCNIGGYQVPEGTWLIVNLWKIHTDPRVWADPLEFQPERFMTTHSHVDVKGKDYELMPFGSGRRGCPGVNFGVQMVHSTLATLLHGFDVSTEDNVEVDMTESFGLTNAKATPLRVFLSPRLSSDLFISS